MNSSPKQPTFDEGYDNLIAFLVIIGALSFILTQSFPKKSTSSSKIASAPVPTKTVSAKKTKRFYKKKSTSSNFYKEQQAARKLKEDGLRKWTDQLEEEQVRNTPFSVPKNTAPVVASAVAAKQLSEKDTTTALPLAPRKLAKEEKVTPPVGTTVVQEESVFIDTNVKKKEEAIPKPSKVVPTPTPPAPSKKEPPVKAPTKAAPIVESYETVSPKIATKSVVEEKSTLTSKETTTKNAKGEEVSCVIMIAALKDRANIDRLIQSLKKENYEVYNKISGKHRTIGVRTACDPSVHQPVLREIKKKYTKSAFFMKR